MQYFSSVWGNDFCPVHIYLEKIATHSVLAEQQMDTSEDVPRLFSKIKLDVALVTLPRIWRNTKDSSRGTNGKCGSRKTIPIDDYLIQIAVINDPRNFAFILVLLPYHLILLPFNLPGDSVIIDLSFCPFLYLHLIIFIPIQCKISNRNVDISGL